MSLTNVYRYGCHVARCKYALEAPTQLDAMMASVDTAPDAPPPEAPAFPQQLPQVPPEIAAAPFPQEQQMGEEMPEQPDPEMNTSEEMPRNIGKTAAMKASMDLKGLNAMEMAMGTTGEGALPHGPAAAAKGRGEFREMQQSIEGQMRGTRPTQPSHTLHIGPNGVNRVMNPLPPARSFNPSVGAQAAQHVITSAPRL